MEDTPDFLTDNIDKGNAYHQPNGRFATGNPGRPVGAKSKGRTALNMFMDAQSENLDKWFEGLASDKERLEYYVRLCPYRFPRMQAVTLTEERESDNPRYDPAKLTTDEIKTVLALNQKMKS